MQSRKHPIAPSANVASASTWLRDNIDLIPPGVTILDVACGEGRNALFLAHAGWPVHAVDRDREKLARLSEVARSQHLPITTEVIDLEEGGPPSLGEQYFGAIVVFNYLYRPLFPSLRAALIARGVLIYETFMVGQEQRGHPRNPAFLLHKGELERLVLPLEILRSREGDFEGQLKASIVARHR